MRVPKAPPPCNFLLVLSVLLALAAAACDGGGSSYRSPVAPAAPAPSAPAVPPPPAPPVTDLTGTWAGTVTVTWDEMDGGGGTVNPVRATFAQTGSAVTGTLTQASGCVSNCQSSFAGTLEGDWLYGDLTFPAHVWGVSGRVSEGLVSITVFNVRWDLYR